MWIASGLPTIGSVHDPGALDRPPMGLQAVRGSDGSICGGLAGHNVTMEYLAFTLSRWTDRTVIDRTGLPARYDVNLQFLPDAAKTAAPEGGGPTISLIARISPPRYPNSSASDWNRQKARCSSW